MELNFKIIEHLSGLEKFSDKIKNLGFVDTLEKHTLTFISESKYISVANKNRNILCAIVELKLENEKNNYNFEVIYSDSAKLNFFNLHNSCIDLELEKNTNIHKTALISKSANIASNGVVIGENVKVEENVTIFPGTIIGNNTIIRAGSCIGSDALYLIYDKAKNNYLGAKHLGKTHISNDVEIGHNSVIDRALFPKEVTFIGDGTKIGCLSNISHSVKIGSNNIFAAGVQISGYCKIQNRNWFGPNVVVSNNVNIDSDCFIALGSRVFRDIPNNSKVIDHRIFKRS